MSAITMTELADRFLSAVERGDLPAAMDCIDPYAVIWHNGTRQTMTREENREVLQGFIARSVSREYRERKLQELPGGFVLQHLLVATAADGFVLEAAACLVCEVEEGRITRIEEYFDWSNLPEWFERTQPQLEAAGLAWPSAWADEPSSHESSANSGATP